MYTCTHVHIPNMHVHETPVGFQIHNIGLSVSNPKPKLIATKKPSLRAWNGRLKNSFIPRGTLPTLVALEKDIYTTNS